MASRENQGLQAALIVFVLLVIGLAVTTYVYFRKAEEEGARATAAEDKASKAEANILQTLGERNKLKEYLGFDIAEQMAVIDKRFLEDMAMFGADYPESDPKNYRTLPNYLLQANTGKATTISETEKREQQALSEKAATEQRVAGEMKTAEVENEQLVAVYTKEREDFKTERDRILAEQAKTAADSRGKDAALAAATATGQQATVQAQAEIGQLQKTIESLLTQKRERDTANFETAIGRITFVNHVERTVWIDVGLADGLQRHTTFSVYDQDVHEYSTEHVKGEIEVTKLIDRHLAEARIVGDNIKNPIVHGDLIYSPAWKPGVFLHFAVTGFIDINGDGIEDKELLRNVISANGGVIDQEADAAGNMVGDMSVNTRYLIMGARPDEKTGSRDPASLAGYSTMYARAQELGVELMPLPRFLSLMGYKAGSKTVNLGGRGAVAPTAPQPRAAVPANAAPPANGAPPAAEGAEPPAGEEADPFRPRTPPRGEAGAF